MKEMAITIIKSKESNGITDYAVDKILNADNNNQ